MYGVPDVDTYKNARVKLFCFGRTYETLPPTQIHQRSTPSEHTLSGKFAPESLDRTAHSARKRWRFVRELVKHFWNRWLLAFFPNCCARKEWHRGKRDFKVNDIVVVIEPNVPKLCQEPAAPQVILDQKIGIRYQLLKPELINILFTSTFCVYYLEALDQVGRYIYLIQLMSLNTQRLRA
ncbi:hypothetical protein GQR58_013939 [Nymphon striatum]|nr:hypothetical protein GQR58_013939 [Nymphon striatum]